MGAILLHLLRFATVCSFLLLVCNFLAVARPLKRMETDSEPKNKHGSKLSSDKYIINDFGMFSTHQKSRPRQCQILAKSKPQTFAAKDLQGYSIFRMVPGPGTGVP